MLTLLAFLTAIAVLVVWHELGHYLAARWCGVQVLRFSVGFGRPLLSWTSRKTGTQWSLAAIPLGGYVAMLDERETEQPIPADRLNQAFNRQTLPKKAFIVVAGPAANFLLAFVLYWFLAVSGTQEPAPLIDKAQSGSVLAKAGFTEPLLVLAIDDVPVRSMNDANWRMTEAALSRSQVQVRVTGTQGTADDAGSVLTADFSALNKNDLEGNFLPALGWRLAPRAPRIAEVVPGSAAERAGLRGGDTFTVLDQKAVSSAEQVIEIVQRSADKPLQVQVLRGDALAEFSVTPTKALAGDATPKIGVGFAPIRMVEVKYDFFDAIEAGLSKTWDITALTLKMLGQIVIGQASLSNLSGPLTIADAAGKTASIGLAAYITFLALVSVGLGVLNLLPVPMLDGGHLLYYAIEGATGRPLPEAALAWGQRIGILLLGALMAVALTNDFVRLLS
jgi:regulator of sigma E protease